MWSPLYGEWKQIPDRFNQLSIELRGGAPSAGGVRVIFRAYDEGLALRYVIEKDGEIRVDSEQTEFRFPATAEAYEEHGTEGVYRKVPVRAIQPGCQWPLTIDYGDGLFAALTEAANTDYPRMLLSPVKDKPGSLVTDLAGPATGKDSLSTPWRVLIIGERPGDLAERNYLVLNLNPPNRISDTSWIRPGKAIREVTLSTRGGMECVDFAVQRGLQYVEYDAGWYGHEYDDNADATTVTPDNKRTSKVPNWSGLDLQKVIRYANRHGIGIFLYINRRHLERQLDELFPLYEKWGVKGVKFGFVRVGEQKWTRWLHEAVRKAAEHKLLVDIHDGYRPTGFSRTYPNLLRQEGIRGNEHMPTARHNVTLPFTRFLAGAGDYTICYYARRIKGTRAHQLALSVVFYSPLEFLFWYDKPSAYHGEPEVDFFRNVPTVWDDTKVLDGRIGEFVVTARRKGGEWFLGAATNEEARVLKIPLGFLDAGLRYRAEIHRDGSSPVEVLLERKTVRATDVLRVALAPSGGQAIRFVPLR